MSNIAELANCPELSFIESMTLQETEEQLRELYTKYYREATGKEPEIGEADPLNLLMKAFCAMEYQTMQYADAKGRMEMLKTSTGDALDALAALVGLTRKEANRATATVRFTLSEAQNGATAIPTGTLSGWRRPLRPVRRCLVWCCSRSAVADFQTWQRKLGRDINPTELIAQLREAGAKRVTLTAPTDTVIEATELPKCIGATVTYGGLEDD